MTPFNNALQMPDVAANLNVHSDIGRAMLDGIVTQQAAMIAYLNDFKLLMILTLAMMPLVLIIRAAGTAPGAKPDWKPRPTRSIDRYFAENSLRMHVGVLAERRHRAVAARLLGAQRRRRRHAAPARSACRP